MYSWDDNEYPVAYLITFRTYGTWQHGDERGSIDRYHNQHRGPRVQVNSILLAQQNKKLKSAPVKLNARQRSCVSATIREICTLRGWRLLAINVRTNHVHVVIAIGNHGPSDALRDLKAYSTKALRQRGLWSHGHGPWVRGGSNRYLWNSLDVSNACDYVINGQGRPLPDKF